VREGGLEPMTSGGGSNRALDAPARRWTSRSAVLLACVLAFSAVIIVRGIHKGEFSYNMDEDQHGLTGLYAADLLRDHPLHPVDYTYKFYAQYPALGVIHWPPLFYGFEGLSFLLLGPNVVAARLTILAFALLGLTAWFDLVQELQNEWTAALATALLALAPGVVLFEKTVMLEVPCLSLCIAASCCWTKYLLYEKRSSLIWFAGFASAALLTKQNSVYLFIFCPASAIALRRWRLLVKPGALWAAFGVALIAGPYYLLVYRTYWQTTGMLLTDTKISGIDRYVFYWKHLPGELGWSLLALSVLGFATSLRWDRRATTLLMWTWIGSCYVTFTLIGTKEERLAIYWLPPIIYFAAGMLTRMFSRQPLRAMASGAAVVLLANSVVAAWSFQRPYVSGYSAAAKAITQVATGGVILYDGDFPANFIFFVCADDPGRHFLVLRKALYAYQISRRFGSEQFVHGQEGVQDLLRRDGVRFVVVSDEVPPDFDVRRTLREMLQSKQFRLLGRFPIFSTEQTRGGDLLLYENELWAPPSDQFLRIRMLTMSHDVVVRFDQFDLVGDPGHRPQTGAVK
jgi:dolichyl-phosphate-mannose-protein mannosyltransferase